MNAISHYFLRRWRGDRSARLLLWRDMLAVGTLINLAATLIAFALALQRVPLGWAVAVHFAPLPYNFFLFATLCRAPDRSAVLLSIGGIWILVATLV